MAQQRAANASFYHLGTDALRSGACRGTACFVAQHRDPEVWRRAAAREAPLYCLGKCFAAPAQIGGRERPPMACHARRLVAMSNLLSGGARDLATYRSRGGYDGLAKALGQTPETVARLMVASGLRGRGGAGFPTGRKWLAVASETAAEKYVVANADEGDPGAYIDRFLIEDDPFCLIEAMTIAAHAVGARRGFIYLRKEYPEALAILEAALVEARAAGLLGEAILGGRLAFDIETALGQGSYICGEETALLNAIEGRRPEVRARPPWISTRGLFGAPTLMNNVETLAAVPWIVLHGPEAYAELGHGESRGTKLLSLNSLFRKPGLYEVEFGVPLRDIVMEIGGGLTEGALKGVIVGGPLAGVLPAALLDTRLDYETMQAVGASVGHGGVIAFDHRTSIAALMEHVFRFGAVESCGKCLPCHAGAPAMAGLFADLAAGRVGLEVTRVSWRDVVEALAETSLCGHGRGLAEFARSIIRYYPEELAACRA
jgi:formate dehydrogenase iron-sulfur subunit